MYNKPSNVDEMKGSLFKVGAVLTNQSVYTLPVFLVAVIQVCFIVCNVRFRVNFRLILLCTYG